MEERKLARRQWEDMSPQLLGLIFARLPADVVLRAVPFVCRSWCRALEGPYCWEQVDLQQWCRRVNRADVIDFAVRKLVRRSVGSLRRLSAYRLGASGFNVTAQCVKFLTVLQIPMSEVSDDMVESYAESLKMLTTLDISYCLKITYKGLQVLGSNCHSLVHLRRNMPPPDLELRNCLQTSSVSNANDEEALAVATTMPKLKHLELSYGLFSNLGLEALLEGCKDLCVLDIRGCWNVNVEGPLEHKCYEIPDFRAPWYDEFEEV